MRDIHKRPDYVHNYSYDCLKYHKTSKIVLTDQQKDAVFAAAAPGVKFLKEAGKNMLDYFSERHYTWIFGQSGSGKTTVLKTRMLELLR